MHLHFLLQVPLPSRIGIAVVLIKKAPQKADEASSTSTIASETQQTQQNERTQRSNETTTIRSNLIKLAQ